MALLVVEDLSNGKLVDRRQLVRYRYKEGHVLPKEVVLTKDQSFFGHFGGHKIVADRFVATHSGSVIDLQTEEVIHDETLGTLVAADASRVLIRIDNIHRESGLFAFDLTTRKATKIEETIRTGPGVLAPDRQRVAFTDTEGRLWTQAMTGRKHRLATGCRASLSLLSSNGPAKAPVFWLDDRTLLTQRRNGQLVTVDGKGEVAAFLDIDRVPEPISLPQIERDAGGRLLYRCESDYVLDLVKRTATLTPWRALGHGFDCEIRQTEEYGSILREAGKEIGRWHCLPWQAVTAPGHLAITETKKSGFGRHPVGVKIWDAPRRQWLSLSIQVNSLVGWFELR